MRLLFCLLSITSVLSACNEDEHHPENGGYFFVGVGGQSDTVNLDSAHGQRLPNATWAGGYYPYGQNEICTAARCNPGCDTEPGCPQFLGSHTCSILKFCPPQGATAGQKVHLMPDFAATDSCDFSGAQEIGSMGVHPEDGCFEYSFEVDHELTEYYFASEEGCAIGQKVAVKIADFSIHADQCVKIGLTTPRIRNCDCNFQKEDTVISEPCRTAFSDSCNDVTLIEGDCCETGTCLSKFEDFNHVEGKIQELERKLACDDSQPGLCYNIDGKGTDTNQLGSLNCCEHTCSACGIDLSPFALWKKCTALDFDTKTGKCGVTSRYAREQVTCDFSKCNDNDHWASDGNAFIVAALGPTDSPTSAPTVTSGSATKGLYGGIFSLILLAVNQW